MSVIEIAPKKFTLIPDTISNVHISTELEQKMEQAEVQNNQITAAMLAPALSAKLGQSSVETHADVDTMLDANQESGLALVPNASNDGQRLYLKRSSVGRTMSFIRTFNRTLAWTTEPNDTYSINHLSDFNIDYLANDPELGGDIEYTVTLEDVQETITNSEGTDTYFGVGRTSGLQHARVRKPQSTRVNIRGWASNGTAGTGLNSSEIVRFVVSASDGVNTISKTITATMNNTPPSFTNSSLPTSVELATDGTAHVLDFAATNVQGGAVTSYTLSGTASAGTTASLDSSVLTVTPSTNTEQPGTFSLTVTTSDGHLESSHTIEYVLTFVPPVLERHVLGYSTTIIYDVSGAVNGIATVSASREDGSFTATDTSVRSIFFNQVRNYIAHGITPYPYGILNYATTANPMNVYITFNSNTTITHYHWRSRNWTSNNYDARAPTTWDVQVFVDGAWSTIHTVTWDTRAKNQTYYWKIPVANRVYTTQYRWRITDTTYNTSANNLHISRMRLYSGDNDPSPNPEPTNFNGLSFT